MWGTSFTRYCVSHHTDPRHRYTEKYITQLKPKGNPLKITQAHLDIPQHTHGTQKKREKEKSGNPNWCPQPQLLSGSLSGGTRANPLGGELENLISPVFFFYVNLSRGRSEICISDDFKAFFSFCMEWASYGLGSILGSCACLIGSDLIVQAKLIGFQCCEATALVHPRPVR